MGDENDGKHALQVRYSREFDDLKAVDTLHGGNLGCVGFGFFLDSDVALGCAS